MDEVQKPSDPEDVLVSYITENELRLVFEISVLRKRKIKTWRPHEITLYIKVN
jgi:hypothetical protein